MEVDILKIFSDAPNTYSWPRVKRNADKAFKKLQTTRYGWLREEHKPAVLCVSSCSCLIVVSFFSNQPSPCCVAFTHILGGSHLFYNAMRAKNHQIRARRKVGL